MINVLVVDDHAILRAGIKQILNGIPDIVVTGEAANSVQALECISAAPYDVVLLDISMPGKSGIETLKQIKRGHPKLAVLILSMYPEDQYATRLIKAGASGYLNKGSAPERLVEAIRKVARGGVYVSAGLSEQLAGQLHDGIGKALHEKLSNREFEIMCLMATGKTPTQIAQELFLSVKTISTYRARVMEKMDMHTNAELTYYAIKNGLVV